MALFTCARVVALLERRAVGLTESERLLTESHLAECASCREQSNLLVAAQRALPGGSEAVLSASSRDLLLKRAFELAGAAPAAPRSPSYSQHVWRWTAAAAALVLVLLLGRAIALHHAAGPALVRDQLEKGKLSTSAGVLEAGAGIPANVPLRVEASARLHVANAAVEASPQTRLTWRAGVETLALDEGEVNVEVEHVAGRRFRVAAPGFVVEVVGTQFKVDCRSVRVSRGLVRVLSSDGQSVLAVLPTGGAWSLPPPVVAPLPAASSVAEPQPEASSTEDEPKARPAAPESAAQRLAAARRLLAEGRIAEAEKSVDTALAASPGSREVAEGRTLLAECAVARGNPARALRLYLDLAHAFAALPAGENALFAGARLSERLGPPERARDLFEQYLRRYPAGRFRQEAERHLQRSAAPTR